MLVTFGRHQKDLLKTDSWSTAWGSFKLPVVSFSEVMLLMTGVAVMA